MKIFITGASGFIGTHVVKRLAGSGHELCCLVRKSSNLSKLEELDNSFVTGDITDPTSLLKGMKGCDCVLNIAAAYSLWEPNKQIYTDVNIEGTRNVMECALETGISKVVHVSSAAIFGNSSDDPITEESPVGSEQFSEYARTKYQGDLIAWKLYKKKGLPLIVIYPGAVLGQDDSKATGEYIQNLVRRRMPALAFNDSIFPWVHVRDVAEVIVRAAEKENNVGEKYLVSKYPLTFGEISKMVSEISGVPLPRISLPDSLVILNAVFLTWLANLIKKPPLWGMSTDQIKTMRGGFRIDGSKAEIELGITYTPIRLALEECIESIKE